jgi:hypothetical protein
MAVTYTLAFVVVCLGVCLAPSAASHACCADEAALRAPAQDCCKVVSGVRGASPTLTIAAIAVAAPIWSSLQTFNAPQVRAARASLTPSPPPLVLRI